MLRFMTTYPYMDWSAVVAGVGDEVTDDCDGDDCTDEGDECIEGDDWSDDAD